MVSRLALKDILKMFEMGTHLSKSSTFVKKASTYAVKGEPTSQIERWTLDPTKYVDVLRCWTFCTYISMQ
jgi:hypothetical protein